MSIRRWWAGSRLGKKKRYYIFKGAEKKETARARRGERSQKKKRDISSCLYEKGGGDSLILSFASGAGKGTYERKGHKRSKKRNPQRWYAQTPKPFNRNFSRRAARGGGSEYRDHREGKKNKKKQGKGLGGEGHRKPRRRCRPGVDSTRKEPSHASGQMEAIPNDDGRGMAATLRGKRETSHWF